MEKMRSAKRLIVALVVAGLLVGGVYGVSRAVKSSDGLASSASGAATAMIPANFNELAERVRDGVVNVQVTKTVKNVARGMPDFSGGPFGDRNPFEEFFGHRFGGKPGGRFEQKGQGSGVVVSRDGYILTNNHVVDDADQIKVKLANGNEYTAKVVGRDPKTDVALIKIDGASGLTPLNLGNSDDLKVGNWVVAIGSPFGLEQTVTAGIVSGKGRVIGSGPYDNFIQTDASINPGNSGGPLVNLKGEVVGINTAIIASGQGIGFAIPINMAKEVVAQLKEKGSVTRGWLGLGIQEVTPQLAQAFGLKDKKGALVSQVAQDGPADKGGIQQGDVIVTFDGKEVADAQELPRLVASTPVGKSVTLKVARNGGFVDRTVKIGQMEQEKVAAAAGPSHKSLGIAVQNLTPNIAEELGVQGGTGVVVAEVEPGSPASEAGLQPGDVIRQVNRAPVKDVQDFSQKIEKTKGQQAAIVLLLQRRGSTLFAAVTPK
jgi:serine protease Do